MRGTAPCWFSVFSRLPLDCYCEVYNFVNVNLASGLNEARKAPKDHTMRVEEAPVVSLSLIEKAWI